MSLQWQISQPDLNFMSHLNYICWYLLISTRCFFSILICVLTVADIIVWTNIYYNTFIISVDIYRIWFSPEPLQWQISQPEPSFSYPLAQFSRQNIRMGWQWELNESRKNPSVIAKNRCRKHSVTVKKYKKPSVTGKNEIHKIPSVTAEIYKMFFMLTGLLVQKQNSQTTTLQLKEIRLTSAERK